MEFGDGQGRGGRVSILTPEAKRLHTCSLDALLAQPQVLRAPQDLSGLLIFHQGSVTFPLGSSTAVFGSC